MADQPLAARDSVVQQRELFRLAEKRFGLKISDISKTTGISESTLRGWRDGAVMSAWGLFALADAGVPDELLALVGKPFGKYVVSAGDMDIEELAQLSADFDYAYASARRPDSESGVEIGHREKITLDEIGERLRATARRRG